VPETRRLKSAVRRVRHCRACGHVWETLEIVLTEKVRAQMSGDRQLSLSDFGL
jgi:transcriptional regulator NrdR family protein